MDPEYYSFRSLRTNLDILENTTYSGINGIVTTQSGLVWCVDGQTLWNLITTTSASLVSQIPSLADYATQAWVSGQIPSLTGYATQVWVSDKLTTTSGDILAQIPSLLTSGSSGGAGGNNTVSGTAGENLAPFDTVYESITDGKFYKAFNNGLVYQADAIGMVTQSTTIISGTVGEITLEGSVTNTNWSWGAGKPLFVSASPGVLIDTNPPTTISGQFIKPVAQAITSSEIWVNPELGWQVGGIYDSVIISSQSGPRGLPGADSVTPGPIGSVGPPGPMGNVVTITGVARYTAPQYSVVYQDYFDAGTYKQAIANSIDTADACGIIINPGGIAANNSGQITIWGSVTYSGWAWVSGKPLILDLILGQMTQNLTVASGYYKPLGWATTTTGIWFQPELGWQIPTLGQAQPWHNHIGVGGIVVTTSGYTIIIDGSALAAPYAPSLSGVGTVTTSYANNIWTISGSNPPITMQGTVAENLGQWAVVYADPTASGYFRGAFNNNTDTQARAIAMVTQYGGLNTGQTGTLTLFGQISNSNWSWPPNTNLWLASPGGGWLTTIKPTATGTWIIPLGHSMVAPTDIWFNPQAGYQISATTIAVGGPLARACVEGRIDLNSPTSSGTSTSLIWNAANGIGIGLWSGSEWRLVTPSVMPTFSYTGTVLNGPTTSGGINYDLYAYYIDDQTFGIIAEAWVNNNTRQATQGRWQGIIVQNPSYAQGQMYRYIGTVRRRSTYNLEWVDQKQQRFILNQYNRQNKPFGCDNPYNTNTSDVNIGASWVSWSANGDVWKVETIADGINTISLVASAYMGPTGNIAMDISIGIDSKNPATTAGPTSIYPNTFNGVLPVTYLDISSLGYHAWWPIVEASSANQTIYYYFSAAGRLVKATFQGTISC